MSGYGGGYNRGPTIDISGAGDNLRWRHVAFAFVVLVAVIQILASVDPGEITPADHARHAQEAAQYEAEVQAIRNTMQSDR